MDIFIEEKERLVKKLLAIKVGGNLPLDFFLCHQEIYDFFLKNNLGEIFLVLQLSIEYTDEEGIFLPIEIHTGRLSWYSWNTFLWKEIDEGYEVRYKNILLFKTNKEKKLLDEYSILMYGIVKYHSIFSAEIRPIKRINCDKLLGKRFLDIKINYDVVKPSHLFRTHAYMELIDENGYVFSVGQDIFDHIKSLPKYRFFQSGKGSSILNSPDVASFNINKQRKVASVRIPITKKEYSRIIAQVESDKYNHQRVASLQKGNCVSYCCRILSLCLDYEVIPDRFSLEMILKEYMPDSIDKGFEWIRKRSPNRKKWFMKAIFFFPPIYFLSCLLGLIVYFGGIRGYKNHKDFSLFSFLFTPWKVRSDVPKDMIEVLKKYVDENNEIDRIKYPSGTIFD